MPLAFEPAILDSEYGDSEGMVVFRDGRLIAVLSRLGALHDEIAGSWFVEASFNDRFAASDTTFVSLKDFEAWFATLRL